MRILTIVGLESISQLYSGALQGVESHQESQALDRGSDGRIHSPGPMLIEEVWSFHLIGMLLQGPISESFSFWSFLFLGDLIKLEIMIVTSWVMSKIPWEVCLTIWKIRWKSEGLCFSSPKTLHGGPNRNYIEGPQIWWPSRQGTRVSLYCH